MTFDLHLWPWAYVKVTFTSISRCTLCNCTLVPSIKLVGSIEIKIWTIVYRKLKCDVVTSSPIRIWWNSNTNLLRAYLSDKLNFILIRHKKAEIQSREVNREQEAFKERRHLHVCKFWPWRVTLTLLQGQEIIWH